MKKEQNIIESQHSAFLQGAFISPLFKLYKEWRSNNFYKNCNKLWVKIGHNSATPKQYKNKELIELWRNGC